MTALLMPYVWYGGIAFMLAGAVAIGLAVWGRARLYKREGVDDGR